MLDAVMALAIPILAVLVLLAFVGFVLARLYQRATREVSLVKTGAGGRKVVIDGGTIVVPLLHEVMRVNMKTLRLEVRRHGEGALITKDRMRVDVGVEFYVSVQGTDEGIARAAQTLGQRTFDVDQLREMIEGKLVDGLRAVAAQMTMDDLHEKRSEFVQQVQRAVAEDLLKNGLELESVSLTALDQTPFDQLDENNAFNAVGMKLLAEVIAKSKKERAKIEAETETAVRQSQMEAALRTFQIEREQEEARAAQSVEVEAMRAREAAEIAGRREEAKRTTETARIETEQAVEAAEIKRREAIQTASITQQRNLEIAEQEKKIAIAQKSGEESKARAAADLARAEAAKAEEAVDTARQVAEAERRKRVAVLAAEEQAEKNATTIRVSAKAEREAAADKAAAMREIAEAEAAQITIRAAAQKDEALAEAEGRTALIAAENALAPQIIDFQLAKARLQAMPGIIAEMVKPAEKIDTIRIHQVSGLGGTSNGAGHGDAASQGGLVDQAFNAIGNMAVHGPALKALGASVGLSLEDGVRGLLDGVVPAADEKSKARAAGLGINAETREAGAVTAKSNCPDDRRAE